MARATPASVAQDQIEGYVADEEEKAARELRAFAKDLAFSPTRSIVERDLLSPASMICTAAREISADLVVVGTCGRAGIARLILGSVAEEVLRETHCDVLAVVPRQDD
jgi:nucleotide-binding universal stress UspA family protein